MKRLIVYALVLAFLLGCSTTMKPCTKYEEVYNAESKTNKLVPYESTCEADYEWYDYVFMPLILVAGVGLGAAEMSNHIASSPNYQAGGAAYKDYTQPQNQPATQPTLNGGGQYGNYPRY